MKKKMKSLRGNILPWSRNFRLLKYKISNNLLISFVVGLSVDIGNPYRTIFGYHIDIDYWVSLNLECMTKSKLHQSIGHTYYSYGFESIQWLDDCPLKSGLAFSGCFDKGNFDWPLKGTYQKIYIYSFRTKLYHSM